MLLMMVLMVDLEGVQTNLEVTDKELLDKVQQADQAGLTEEAEEVDLVLLVVHLTAKMLVMVEMEQFHL